MAKRAVLSVCGEDFDLLEFNITLHQKINNMGKPASGVYLGDFYFIIPGGNDLFFDWLSDPTRMESGIVKVYYKASSSPFVEYEFVQGFITTIMENLYNNEGIGNAFNQVSMLEDNSEEFELWTNFFSTRDFENSKILANTIEKTRQFQQRTGIEHVLMVTLSCEQVKIRNTVLDNRWTTERK